MLLRILSVITDNTPYFWTRYFLIAWKSFLLVTSSSCRVRSRYLLYKSSACSVMLPDSPVISSNLLKNSNTFISEVLVNGERLVYSFLESDSLW